MISIRKILRPVSRVPMPALLLFLFFGIFVISQYISDIAVVKSESYVFSADEYKKEMIGNVGSYVLDSEGHMIMPPRWTYSCDNNACKRREAEENEEIKSLDVCWLTCGSHGSVWPFPKFQTNSTDSMKFLPKNIQLVETLAVSEEVRQLMQEAFQIKQNHFENFPGLTLRSRGLMSWWPFGSQTNQEIMYAYNLIKVTIASNSTEEILSLTTDESYEINIEETTVMQYKVQLSVIIKAKTFFGFRHGLETLSQLIALDASGECLQIIKTYYAKDQPAFPYRGILIDSARNFVPVSTLKRIVDGMSFNKLNMLHLHLADSNTFAFHSNRVPQLTQYGALSENQVYFSRDLRELVKYARLRGVKIIPELDGPSHAGNGWQFGKKFNMGDLAFYINAYNDSWNSLCGQPPCGILNPMNHHVYDLLEKVYLDMLEVFDKDLFHMGGDEVYLESWTSLPELQRWMIEKRLTGMGLWKYFQSQAFERLRRHSKNATAILWTSTLTAEESQFNFLNTSDYIIQVWEPSNSIQIKNLLHKGFSLIMSYVDKFYLDWGEGTWLGSQHDWSYHNWQKFYDTKIDILQGKGQILGAEAPLWSEKTGSWQVEVKLWPRAAAFAENLWSYPQRRRNGEVYSRLNYQNYRMQQRGIPTGQLQPESCLHFNGHCRNSRNML